MPSRRIVSNDEAKMIRLSHAIGWPSKRIARGLGLREKTVSDILNWKTHLVARPTLDDLPMVCTVWEVDES